MDSGSNQHSGQQRLYGIPVQTSRWRIAFLRLIYRRWWAVQIRGKVYILREPR